jgi:ferredoxin
MTKVTIIGSGPAAAAAALALTRTASCEIEILDIGERLEPEREAVLREVRHLDPAGWPAPARRLLSVHPTAENEGELPEKRVFGSDFPFRDAGQLVGLSVAAGGNARSVSGAFGGFSNVWGAQVMPFSRATLDEWAGGYEALLPHYRAVLEHIPFAGVDDDYSDLFPLLARADPLPTLAPPAAATLRRYDERRSTVRARGVTVGQARLAIRARDCVECGLCLTGCPHSLIWASTKTLEPLIQKGAVSYRSGLLVLRVGEDEDGCWIEARDGEGRLQTIRSDRILLACGGLGTTRLVLASLRRRVAGATLHESVQFVLPFVSARPYPDPRSYLTFTLNQFNILVEYGRPGLDLAQVHLYPYNPGYEQALPGPVKRREFPRRQILQRVLAGLGYLPSWASPSVRVKVGEMHDGELLPVELSVIPQPATRRVLTRVLARLFFVAPALDLWPAVPALRLSGPGKSYHFGGSFPHVAGKPRADRLETDMLGRPAEWTRVHLIDASVFSSIAATTFTLTVMANAHRIATLVARELS